MNPMYVKAALICYANDNDALIPEHWANESLAILEANMVVANMVHRDFQKDLAEFGDVVNTRRPAERKSRRRTDSDDYDEADVSVTNVRVALDQLFYDSFIIKDKEASLSFKDLLTTHLQPAMLNIAQSIDRAVLGRVHNFLKTPTARAGRLNGMTGANAASIIREAKTLMSQGKAYEAGRNLLVSAMSEGAILDSEQLISAEKRGDGGTALEQAIMGRIYGFSTGMSQNVNYVDASAADTVSGTVTNALAAGGSGTQACSVALYEAIVGEYATVAGNDQPTHITARTASTNTTAVTFNEANKYATLASAAIVVYKACDVHGDGSDYAAGWSKDIVLDGHTSGKGPQIGQLLSFGTGGSRHTYTVIEATTVSATSTKVLLDRPLDVQVDDDDKAFPGPAGSINLAFHRDALALVTRPLALPPSSFGVAAANASYNGVGMRVVMQYDSKKGGTRVNLDILAGTAILDEKLACVVLG
jgi:hypothetical protein